MLYLAEVKVQNRGFVGGYKTELKLLAVQASDQTWNIVSGDDIITTDSINDQTGKGTLYILNLDGNKQLQSNPELAGQRIVNYLRHLSRTLEKSKAQEEEIETWKESLQLQGEEIGRRQAELDQQQQLLQQQQQELARLEEEKEKLSGAWEQVRQEQTRSNQNKEKLNNVIQEFSQSGYNRELLPKALSALDNQQALLDNCWQQLEVQKTTLQQKQQALNSKKQSLLQQRQELKILYEKLQQAVINFELQEHLLKEKESAFERINNNYQAVQRLDDEVNFLMDDSDETDIDFQRLESMPLGELEEVFNNLQQETSKLVNFVNMQEEELSLQSNEVKEVQHKLSQATEVEKFSLETELADAQEAMKLLNETLVGQRRNLKKQQKVLNEHLKILSRRKGLADVEFSETVSLRPLKDEIEVQKDIIARNKEKVESEMNSLRQTRPRLEQELNQVRQQYEQKQAQTEILEEEWLNLYQQVAKIEVEVELLEQNINPLQQELNSARNQLQSLEPANKKIEYLLQQIQSIL